MAHTLENVEVILAGEGVTLEKPNNNTDVYYTVDGTDPMGADGIVSPFAIKYTADTVITSSPENLVVRPFTTNNWGPKTIQ